MTAQHRCARLILMAAGFFGFFCANELALRCRPVGLFASANGGPQDISGPKHVLIIRHAEKPDDEGDENLTSRGAARAAALPSLFVAPPIFPTKPAPFPTPDFIFASKASAKSNRPVETVTPLAKALSDMHIHHKHKDNDFQAVVDHVFSDAKFAGKTVLICWHHGRIPDLARAVAATGSNGDETSRRIPDLARVRV